MAGSGMKYRVVLDDPGARPAPDWNPDTLFDADSHSECEPGRAPLWFLCTRRLYVIEHVDDAALEAQSA